MKARIVKIGNSRGIRLPKPLIEQAGLTEEVDILVEGNRLVIAPSASPREHWDAAFQKMARHGDDALLDVDTSTASSWDHEEWEWEE